MGRIQVNAKERSELSLKIETEILRVIDECGYSTDGYVCQAVESAAKLAVSRVTSKREAANHE